MEPSEGSSDSIPHNLIYEKCYYSQKISSAGITFHETGPIVITNLAKSVAFAVSQKWYLRLDTVMIL